EADEWVEILEHASSVRFVGRIAERLGDPAFDPHWDAIPDAAGQVRRERFVLLRDAAAGHEGRVLRLSDRDPALLRSLEDDGIDVGRTVRVVDAATVAVDGTDAVLPEGAPDALWLTA